MVLQNVNKQKGEEERVNYCANECTEYPSIDKELLRRWKCQAEDEECKITVKLSRSELGVPEGELHSDFWRSARKSGDAILYTTTTRHAIKRHQSFPSGPLSCKSCRSRCIPPGCFGKHHLIQNPRQQTRCSQPQEWIMFSSPARNGHSNWCLLTTDRERINSSGSPLTFNIFQHSLDFGGKKQDWLLTFGETGLRQALTRLLTRTDRGSENWQNIPVVMTVAQKNNRIFHMVVR